MSATAGTLARIDAATNATSTITVGSDPVAVAVAPTDGSIWVANSGDGTHRVGDYQHNPQWGVLMDQLWVR